MYPRSVIIIHNVIRNCQNNRVWWWCCEISGKINTSLNYCVFESFFCLRVYSSARHDNNPSSPLVAPVDLSGPSTLLCIAELSVKMAQLNPKIARLSCLEPFDVYSPAGCENSPVTCVDIHRWQVFFSLSLSFFMETV